MAFCKVFLCGDSDAVWVAMAADEALTAIERGRTANQPFIRLDMVVWVRGETPRPAYFDPAAVSAILPGDEREYEHALDDPPEWLT